MTARVCVANACVLPSAMLISIVKKYWPIVYDSEQLCYNSIADHFPYKEIEQWATIEEAATNLVQLV